MTGICGGGRRAGDLHRDPPHVEFICIADCSRQVFGPSSSPDRFPRPPATCLALAGLEGFGAWQPLQILETAGSQYRMNLLFRSCLDHSSFECRGISQPKSGIKHRAALRGRFRALSPSAVPSFPPSSSHSAASNSPLLLPSALHLCVRPPSHHTAKLITCSFVLPRCQKDLLARYDADEARGGGQRAEGEGRDGTGQRGREGGGSMQIEISRGRDPQIEPSYCADGWTVTVYERN